MSVVEEKFDAGTTATRLIDDLSDCEALADGEKIITAAIQAAYERGRVDQADEAFQDFMGVR